MTSRLSIILILVGQVLTSYSTSPADSIQLRVKNNSRFHIIKLTILDNQIEDIKPGKKSDYFSVRPFHPSLKVDITFVKKGEIKTAPWNHVITYPIDNVGETIISNKRNTLVIEIKEGETSGQFEIDTWIKKE